MEDCGLEHHSSAYWPNLEPVLYRIGTSSVQVCSLFLGISGPEKKNNMTQLIFQYSYLQVLDFLTTIAFLLHGVKEGNPVVLLAIQTFPSPIFGLVFVKILAIGLGAACWYSGKERLLQRINVGFAVLVAWNLISIIIQSSHMAGLA